MYLYAGSGVPILLFILLLLAQRGRQRKKIIRVHRRLKKKGIQRIMSIEMLNEFTGKQVMIYLEGELSEIKGTILSVEENWIKVDTKTDIRLLNADIIRQIRSTKPKASGKR